MSKPPNIEALSTLELRALVVNLLDQVSALGRVVAEQRDEIARLKGLNGRPDIKPNGAPSGMEKASRPVADLPKPARSGGGPKTQRRVIHEDRVVKAAVPAGSRFKGYANFVVQDLVLRVHTVRYRRERWVTPDGETVTASLPAAVTGHFGPALQRFLLAQYHQGQVTVARLLDQVRSIGIDVSKRHLVRLLIDGQDLFRDEARDVLRAGLETARWITIDDTGARHKSRNGYCTQIGNDDFTWFGTTGSKSRLNFLECLRAGHTDYAINDAALAYMRGRSLSCAATALLATRSDDGRACRDTFLGLAKTCRKLGVSFWDYLGDRLAVPDVITIPPLPNLVRKRAAPA